MKLVKLGAAVLNQTPIDWDGNLRNIEAAIAEARSEQVSILCLPELCITGYGCEDAFHSTGLAHTALEQLIALAPASHGMIVSVGLPLFVNRALYNAAALLVDGKIAGFVAKQNLAGDGIHYEPRWFKAWPDDRVVEIEVAGSHVPAGDVLFDCGGIKIGFEICEDAWVAARPGSQMTLAGVDVILNPSASHFAFGKDEVRRGFVQNGSRAFGVAYVYANLLGNEAGRIIYDGGAMIAASGRLLATGRRFGYADHVLTTALVDIDEIRAAQARLDSYRPDVSDRAVDVAFVYPELEPQAPVSVMSSWEDSSHHKEEEFTRAVALGLFDYLRKSRSGGFVVSLSGGADSAATASLVALMCHLAWAELGKEGIARKLDHLELSAVTDPHALVGELLTCAYQATRNSGPVTRAAARGVAEAIGARYFEIDVDGLVEGYVDRIAAAIGRPLAWETDDIALQNIQARVRGPSVWLLANLRRALLLTTSNRSEAAVGYATMDGDTCGGLAPIAGIDKAYLRTWLSWLEKVGPDGGSAISALAAVNSQAPTAELRPAQAGQTDEADLMPYDLLDAIEGAAIGHRHTPLEVFREMRARFGQYSAAELAMYIERFFRLWSRNQWKRERYAPSFHVDDKNLDPKTWCRFPILSGGFDRELAELCAYVAAL